MVLRREPEDVYKTLVADLSTTLVPTSIMGFTLVGVDLFAWWFSARPLLLLAAIAGGLASIAKIVLILVQLRRNARGETTLRDANRWESLHALAASAIALSVGTAVATIFRQPDLLLQMLATSLLFGYCAGIVVRIAIRPYIANMALVIATIPAIVAAAQWNDTSHRIIAIMFGIFLLGAFESVQHVYQNTVRHIAIRLDMAALARNDPLTRLSNRLGLREAFREATFHRGHIAVHCLDLDGFKAVNDQFGHAGGDEILVGVAHRLQAIARDNATVARVGGDEFVVLQWGVNQDKEVEALAHDIVTTLSAPFTLANQTLEIGASLGYAIATVSCKLDDILRRADEASYRIKRNRSSVA